MGKALPDTAPASCDAERAPTSPVRDGKSDRRGKDASAGSDAQAPRLLQPRDRRSSDRGLTSSANVTLSSGRAASFAQQDRALPETFPWMALGIVIAFAVAIAVSLDIPTVEAALAGLAGAIVAWCGRLVTVWQEKSKPDEDVAFAAATAIVLLSAAGAGFGFGHWMYQGELDFRIGVASLVSLSAVFATILSGRTFLIIVGQCASWLPLVVLDGSGFAFAGLALATVVTAAVTRYQTGVDRENAEREEAEGRIRDRAQAILADYEETGQGWFWETDRRGQLTYLSPSVEQALGKDRRQLIGTPLPDLFELSEDNREGERTLTFHVSSRSSFRDLAVRAAISSEDRWWSINGRPVYDRFGNFCGFRGSGTDLTEKKRSQENATRLARYDSLTGLANRAQISARLEEILQSPHERECAVLMLDLDRFKHVNDTLGHPAGDALLQQVAQRLERAVGQMGLCGRLGGDEFKVIIPGRTPRERLGYLARDIIHALSQPYSIDGQRVVIGASVGIAVAPENGLSSEAIIRNSDLALYAAKDGGRGRYHFYSNDLHAKAKERSLLEQELRDAIAAGQLMLHYQPVVEAGTSKLTGFEALIRWHHQKRGWISPEKFIPIAEDAGLVGAIGEWVLRTACHDLASWPTHIRCAINVSPLQFANPQFSTLVTNAIAQAGIDPARLELEITESVFLDDDQGTDAMFTALKRIGVRLALDDFGTGYSSLGYLKRAPFNKIKIDQSFVRGATQPGSQNGAIIASITDLAKSLDMDTTAEGVETLDELELVRRLGCSHVQGFVFGRAMTGPDATELVAREGSLQPTGPRSARAKRWTMLRKVVLAAGGQRYQGTVRNLSESGACVEGLWNVPSGTGFSIALADDLTVSCTAIWCEKDRIGVKFAEPLRTDDDGSISFLAKEQASPVPGRARIASQG